MKNNLRNFGLSLVLVTVVCVGSLSRVSFAQQGQGETHESRPVCLTAAEKKEFGIKSRVAGPGEIIVSVSLTGEVKFNRDRVARVVSMVPGVVTKVKKVVGDPVRRGEVMAVIQSRELADAKSAYLASRERLALALAAFKREELLWNKKISSQQDYLEAKQRLAESQIAKRSTMQKLMALGFTDNDLKRLTNGGSDTLAKYEVKAPINGTVVEKTISMGEAVEAYGPLFLVADLRSVWVDLDVYQKDLGKVFKGQKVTIMAGEHLPSAVGTIAYVGPVMSEQTRTAVARVILDNSTGQWRPGLFVTALAQVDSIPVKVLVPRSAVQQVDGNSVVFVETDKGFMRRPIVVGRSDSENVEVISGLEAGERYAYAGAFTIKCETEKESFGGDEH